MNLSAKYSFKKISLFLILTLIILFPIIVMAQGLSPTSIGLEYGSYSGLKQGDLRFTVVSIIRMLMGLLGVLAVVIMIYAGFTWMTAGGNEEKVGKAKKLLFYCAIGLAVILSAYAITSFILNKLVIATTGRIEWGWTGGKWYGVGE